MDFIFPIKTRSISLTGNSCSLNCAHCGGRYLAHMTSVNEFLKSDEKNITSVLVSGGCDADGKVPLLDYSIELVQLKRNYRIVAHTGLFPPQNAGRLSGLVDVVSFDFPQSNRVINEVFGIGKKQLDYIDSLRALAKHVRVVPHMTIGLMGGLVDGETSALDALSALGFKKVVLNVFIPTKGTALEKSRPPPLPDTVSVLKEARKRFDTVYLGCMRPQGEYRRLLDNMSLEYVDGIVMPGRGVMRRVPDARILHECCAL